MIFYLTVLLICWLFSYGHAKTENRLLSAFFLLCAFAAITLPAVLRTEIGTDYNLYYDGLEILAAGGEFDDWWEPGVMALAEWVISTGLDFQWFFVILSIGTYAFVLLSFEKRHHHVGTFVYLIVCYLPSYNMMRQALAIAMCYPAVAFLRRGRWPASFGIVCAAVLFHRSVLLYFVLFAALVVLRNVSVRAVVIVGISMMCISLLLPVEQLLFGAMARIPLLSRYAIEYSGDAFYAAAAGRSLLGYALWAGVFGFLSYLLYGGEGSRWRRGLALTSFLGAVVAVSSVKMVILDRITILFQSLLPFVFVEAVRTCSADLRKKVGIGLTLALMLVYFAYHYTRVDENGSSVGGVVPYRSFLTE